jgi:hypothetical protein
MQTAWKVTEADRDEKGSIKVASDEPRSLADLLPKPSEVKPDARRQPWTRTDLLENFPKGFELATLAAVALIAAFVVIYAWATPETPTAAPVARPQVAPTVQPTAAPTSAPAPTATPVIPTPAPVQPVAVPAPAPAAAPVAAPVPCTQDTAPYVVSRRVMDGTLPIGEVVGFSCVSAAEAEANADEHEAEVRNSYAATREAR